jgi:hypothetical protein
MHIETQLQLGAALALHKRLEQPDPASEVGSEASELATEIEKLGFQLKPVHPGQTHPLLAPYFMIDVPDSETAQRVIDLLSGNKLVEAAYLQPDEGAP